MNALPFFTQDKLTRGETEIFRKSRPPTPVSKRWLSKQEYESFDWSKTNQELAIEHGIHYGTVRAQRIRLGKPPVKKYQHEAIDSTGWDWNYSNGELARRYGVSMRQVSLKRLALGKPKSTIRMGAGYTIKPRHTIVAPPWENLDWNRHDAHIATEVGVSRERVRQKRIELRKPKWNNSKKRFDEFAAAIGDKAEVTYAEIIPLKGSIQTKRRWLSKMGVKYKKRQYFPPTSCPWPHINWDLPTSILSEVWNIKSNCCSNHRNRDGGNIAQFRSTKGIIPPEWIAVVDAEKQKAAAWFAERQKPA